MSVHGGYGERKEEERQVCHEYSFPEWAYEFKDPREINIHTARLSLDPIPESTLNESLFVYVSIFIYPSIYCLQFLPQEYYWEIQSPQDAHNASIISRGSYLCAGEKEPPVTILPLFHLQAQF